MRFQSPYFCLHCCNFHSVINMITFANPVVHVRGCALHSGACTLDIHISVYHFRNSAARAFTF